MKTETLSIAGRTCYLFTPAASAEQPCIYWGVGAHEHESLQQTEERVRQLAAGRTYALVAYEAGDWNREFSPWEAPAVFGQEAFSGGGEKTLDWLLHRCIPFVEDRALQCTPRARLLAGYSLAGLFSLWAFYRTGAFAGVASCSGSLWFPGWLDFAEQRPAPDGSIVYLSLGEKEEKTRNAIMATVGDRTRQMEQLLAQDAAVRAHTLQWQPGGHFREPSERMAQGMAWLLQKLPENTPASYAANHFV